MAKKQTRRSISVSRTTYERLKAFCETNHISMSQLVETRVNDFLGASDVPAPAPSIAPARPAPMMSSGAMAPRATVSAPRSTEFRSSHPGGMAGFTSASSGASGSSGSSMHSSPGYGGHASPASYASQASHAQSSHASQPASGTHAAQASHASAMAAHVAQTTHTSQAPHATTPAPHATTPAPHAAPAPHTPPAQASPPAPMTSAAARYAVEPPPPIIKPRQDTAAPKPAEKRADQIFTF